MAARSGGSRDRRKGKQIHCYGDSGTPAMYYYGSSTPEPSNEVYAIGIGYSYKDCVADGPPTKFIKITQEILKWLSQRAKNIIDVNLQECKLGK